MAAGFDWLNRMSDNSRLTTSIRPLSAGSAGRRLLGQSGKARTLDFEMAQDVMQPVLDPSEIAGVVIGGR